MQKQQVQQLLAVGGVLQFTASDTRSGPCTWGGMRMHDGLAVCVQPMPEGKETDQQVTEWLVARGRRWLFVQDVAPGWAFVEWHPGHGEPVPHQNTERVLGDGGDLLLLLVAAACKLAQVVYPDAWASYVSEAVEVDVVAVYPVQGTDPATGLDA